MLNLGLIGFTQPWLLTALVALPALWWLLRIIPPAPKLVRFPAVRFLLGIEPEEETSARTPLWLLLLRLFLAALLILALSGPVLNPEPEIEGDGPLVLVVDDGWAAYSGWKLRTEAMERFADRAVRQNREVVLLGTAPDPVEPVFRRFGAADALPSITSWQPKPWPTRRDLALAKLKEEPLDGAEVVWLTDGIADEDSGLEKAREFAMSLRDLGPLTILTEPESKRTVILLPPDRNETDLVVTGQRAKIGQRRRFDLKALGPESQVLARQPLIFEGGSVTAEAVFELPLDVRNRIARFELEPGQGASGVVLLDERWRRRSVGLVGLGTEHIPQPLLSELYYIERALRLHADLRQGDIPTLLDSELSAIVLTDNAQIGEDERTTLSGWIEEGGVLIRFAGSRLANADFDNLVPVPLRRGDRFLDGTLSWARPLPLTSFDEGGPLAGLGIPEDDIVVNRQVLAQPGPALAAHSWARLSDGTPLITGMQRGDGWLVLVHTTANNAWSSLPLSGLFVDILRRIVGLGAGQGGAPEGLLAPIEVLDAGGRLVEPGPSTQPVPGDQISTTEASAQHPPGLYGAIGASEDTPRQALNLAGAINDFQALGEAEFGGGWRDYLRAAEVSLMPWILLAALVLALADMIIGLWLRGLLPGMTRGHYGRRTAQAGILLLLAFGVSLPITDLRAQSTRGDPTAPAGQEPAAGRVSGDEQAIIEAANETHLAYVITGLAEIDEVSRAGLDGLSLVLNRRTAVEAGVPLAVDLARDDLDLYPLLYWPIPQDHPDISTEVRARVDKYLRQGGMILFDTGDAGSMIPGRQQPGVGERRLRQLLSGINLPPLEPVPEDHTLTRSFYLLQEFPGRWTGGTVWVDRPEPSVNDGVSSVIIGGHGWAAAWAIDAFTMPMFPVIPGGERQREMASRFGVNLVMYALTGNYKTDQVHIPALLERLGQ
ncbi:MAG: DUF4159 domain-containing protein [Geminicoccaceae bacterium]